MWIAFLQERIFLVLLDEFQKSIHALISSSNPFICFSHVCLDKVLTFLDQHFLHLYPGGNISIHDRITLGINLKPPRVLMLHLLHEKILNIGSCSCHHQAKSLQPSTSLCKVNSTFGEKLKSLFLEKLYSKYIEKPL